MSSPAINKYFDATAQRPIRPDLMFAADLVEDPKLAVDCGCGAGADIQYLAGKGFRVYGFDIEAEAIARCTARFKDMGAVTLTQASFSSYQFPRASLVVADASLFFCASAEFPDVWRRIHDCLYPRGIFCGSFLGPDDTMASAAYNRHDYWPDVAVFDEREVRELFADYEMLRFTVHRSSGTTPAGDKHDWHIHSVVARKR